MWALTERYVIDRNQIALVFDGAGNQTHRYLYGTAVDQVLADETATGMVWALADREGTVTDLIDNNGVVVNHITYDSFGKVVSQSNAGVGFRYGYTGRETDNDTGLDYYRARYYDAGNGRFISEDPIGFRAGDSNLTRYVRNNAINKTDPSGDYTIELVQNPLEIGGLPARYEKYAISHAFILVTNPPPKPGCNDPGRISQKYYRGGPRISDFVEQIKRGDSGPIVTESGEYEERTTDYISPSKQIKTLVSSVPGVFPKYLDTKFKATLSKIQSSNFKYFIFGPNSNTVAHQLLTDVGIRYSLPFGANLPGWDYDFDKDNLAHYEKPSWFGKEPNVFYYNLANGPDYKDVIKQAVQDFLHQ